jgi:TetR/AcrR family transcriptional regulator, tetracycline repressor protein
MAKGERSVPVERGQAVRTALHLLDDGGLDKLTVRRVAASLGVQAPALYWHFESKRALLDHMTDAMLAPVAANLGRPGPDEQWWRWLERSVEAIRAGLLAHRDGGRVALGADLRRARALGTFADRVTEVLHGAGFGLADASRAAGALTHFVVGRVVEEQARPDPAVEADLLAAGGLPFPTLAAAMRERNAAGATADDDFDYSLAIMITGLRTLHDRRPHRA